MILSIIITYYNRPSQIKRLLECLIPQLTDKTELIIVNDGSNMEELDNIIDNILLCNIKINNKPEIITIHLKENSGGASIPRNIGLDNAKGKYIAFIDSDDMIKPNYIEKITEKIIFNEKKITNWDYCYISWECSSNKIIIKNEPPTWNCCVWNCIYKKELIGDTRFNPQLRIAEDYEFNKKVKNGKKSSITDILYYYEQYSPDSLVNSGKTYNDKYKGD